MVACQRHHIRAMLMVRQIFLVVIFANCVAVAPATAVSRLLHVHRFVNDARGTLQQSHRHKDAPSITVYFASMQRSRWNLPATTMTLSTMRFSEGCEEEDAEQQTQRHNYDQTCGESSICERVTKWR